MGLFKSIGKAFKKVFKVAKKVLPIALAVGAVVFTGGAALGLAPFAGGWAAAAGGITSAIGLGGTTFGSVLTGAITHAGFGAAIGGALGGITGGKEGLFKGAQMGAAAGAVTGGVSGGFGAATGGASAGSATPATGMANNPEYLTKLADTATKLDTAGRGVVATSPGATGFSAASSLPNVSGTAPGLTTATARLPALSPTAASAGGGLSRFGDWVTQNQFLVGNAIQGLASGFGKSEAEEYGDVRREEWDRIAGSYRMGDSAYATPVVDNTPRPSPATAFNTRRRYRYDRERGEIVRG